MGEWQRIADLFDFEKGSLQSSKCTPGEYTFITAAEEWKTHNEFTHHCEALIFAMGASGSLGRTHYFKGKFISSDLCFILQPKKHLKLDLTFYYYIFNFLRTEIVSKLAKGTSKLAINQKSFGEYKLPYFDYDHQLFFREKLKNIGAITSEIGNEFDGQLTYLKQLRQAVLQEAVEGKLTAAWRKQHSVVKGDPQYDAAALLAQIKIEKDRLVKEGKIRKEKPLPLLADADKPFDLPDGWVWCQLGELCLKITDGTHQTPTYVEKGRMFLSAQNIKPFKFMPEIHKYVSEQAFQDCIKNRKPELGDVLVARVGAGIGEAAVIDQDIEFAFYVSLGLVKPIHEALYNRFLIMLFNSPMGVDYSKGNIASSGTSAGNFNLEKIRTFPIPLPTISEQQAIVARVDNLMSDICELENQVAERKEQAQLLMQAVLREAFDGGVAGENQKFHS